MSADASPRPDGYDPDPDGDFDATDPYSHPGFRAFARRVRDELVPKIEQTNVLVTVMHPDDTVSVKFAVELGMALLLDKPLVLARFPGAAIPDRLARIADAVVDLTNNPQHNAEALAGLLKPGGQLHHLVPQRPGPQ